mgnify:CR=1 FL=1|tara:strand:+ start:2420 stop:2734 length:315 start_codon:yes stop_codon:yes gene_type:complete
MNLKEWYKYLYNEVNITELERASNAGRDMYAKFSQAIYDKLKQNNTDMLTITQVAERYNTSVDWVRKAVREGNFPEPLKFTAKMHRWEIEALDSFDASVRDAKS